MMNEDRPYAGILMKDGTEISHYGVKGMKWGKKLFGKVKGVFGKPDSDLIKTKYKGSKIDPDAVSRKGNGKNPGSNTVFPAKKTSVHVTSGYKVERDADGKPFYSKKKVKGKNIAPPAPANSKKKK